VVNGVGVFIGAAIGGIIISRLPPIYGYGFFTLILISGGLRLLVRMIFMPMIKEVKNVEGISNMELFFRSTGVKPIVSALQDVINKFE
jgi:uncharacterized membrane protein YfcA